MIQDKEWTPISALQHYVYCPRQCALIHIDMAWEDNLFTLRGQRAHEKVNVPETILREELTIERSLPIWSERLKIIGIADIIEILSDGTPYPVEYKVGSKKSLLADKVQLCAQAMCLEEMFNTLVSEGALFYHGSRRRQKVLFTSNLRQTTEHVIKEVQALLEQNQLPAPVADNRCNNCSLEEICMPGANNWIQEEKKI